MLAPLLRGHARAMFAELALIDWLALVVAAVLLSGAVAALVLALITARYRYRTSHVNRPPAAVHRVRQPTVARSTSPGTRTIDLRRPEETEAPPVPSFTSTPKARSDRAKHLTKRPEPEHAAPPLLEVPESEVAAWRSNRRAGFAARAPGFFEDPIGRHEQRYWDGERWTEHVKEEGQRFVDPL